MGRIILPFRAMSLEWLRNVEKLPITEVLPYEYVTEEPTVYDVLGERLYVPAGFRFYIGAQIGQTAVVIPPAFKGLLRASLLHDYLYELWGDIPGGIAHADRCMWDEMVYHGTPFCVRKMAYTVVTLYRYGNA